MADKTLRTLRGLRADLNLSQDEMAEKLQIPRNTYQRYENYKFKVPVPLAIKIADLCGITDLRTIKWG